MKGVIGSLGNLRSLGGSGAEQEVLVSFRREGGLKELREFKEIRGSGADQGEAERSRELTRSGVGQEVLVSFWGAGIYPFNITLPALL